jgi:hypothetical protein
MQSLREWCKASKEMIEESLRHGQTIDRGFLEQKRSVLGQIIGALSRRDD